MSITGHRVFLGRQPILGISLNTEAYELLYRGAGQSSASFLDGDAATAQVIINAVAEFGLRRVVGDKLAFVNLTREHLLSEHVLLLPRDHVVIEVLENVTPDAEVVQAVTRLRQEGYTIALDDFIYTDAWKPLVELASVIKLDANLADLSPLAAQVDRLLPFNVKLLAEKVETHEVFEFCRKLGFEYFQGYFFCKPQVLADSAIPANRLSIMRLLAKLQDPTLRSDELAAVVSEDVTVSYNLLRFINSAATAVPREVTSIHHAIQLVGTRRIRSWASLLVLAGVEGKARELLMTAIARARTCEQIAISQQRSDSDQFFTVGLFSVLDALLDRPLPEAVAMLPLTDEVKRALLEQRGPMGQALRAALAFERGDWTEQNLADIPPDAANDAFMTSVEWTRETTKEMGF